MLTFQVKVVPNASKNSIEWDSSYNCLKIRVSASPEKNKANKAVCKLLSKTLGISSSAVNIVSGETQRTKKIAVSVSYLYEEMLLRCGIHRQQSIL